MLLQSLLDFKGFVCFGCIFFLSYKGKERTGSKNKQTLEKYKAYEVS